MSSTPATEIVTSPDGTGITVDRCGAGPAVVLIGAGPTTRYNNMGLVTLLADQLTVFNYDRRGRGDSGDTLPYSVEREFEDLAAVLDLAGGTAAVYGTSGGAIWALEAAARGLGITGLVLWEPPYIADDETTRTRPVGYAEQVAELVADGHPGEAVELFFTKAVGMPPEFVAPMRDAPFWPQMEATGTGLVYDAQLIGDFTMPAARLGTVAAPTLVVDGNTTSWLSHTADVVAAALPTARRQTLEGQPHNVADDAIAPVVIDFVLIGTK
jgi:pimeloyl-ACP methyl ester carboxylesterase